jgi:hypothetical protein
MTPPIIPPTSRQLLQQRATRIQSQSVANPLKVGEIPRRQDRLASDTYDILHLKAQEVDSSKAPDTIRAQAWLNTARAAFLLQPQAGSIQVAELATSANGKALQVIQGDYFAPNATPSDPLLKQALAITQRVRQLPNVQLPAHSRVTQAPVW